MKKTILSWFIIFSFTNLIYGKEGLNFSLVIDPTVEIFTEPNFQGTRIELIGFNNTLNLPIPYRPGYKNISVRVTSGYVAYINVCDEFNEEVMVYENSPNLRLYSICTLNIKVDFAVHKLLAFHGFTTDIHNNDCKKIFGQFKLQMQESRPGGGTTACIVTSLRRGDENLISGYDQREVVVFQRTSAANTSQPTCRSPYVFARSHSFNYHESTTGGTLSFVVGASAITENRVSFVSYANLHTAHKMNDLATYNPDIQLRPTLPITRTLVSLPSGEDTVGPYKILQFGPYTNPRSGRGDRGHSVQIILSVF